MDIIDEAIEYFRFNALAKSRFDIREGCDKILVYLTLWIHCCLSLVAENVGGDMHAIRDMLLEMGYSKSVASSATLVRFNEAVTPFFSKPFTDKDKKLIREYLEQIRIETVERLWLRITDGETSKFWLQYGRINIFGM